MDNHLHLHMEPLRLHHNSNNSGVHPLHNNNKDGIQTVTTILVKGIQVQGASIGGTRKIV